MPFKPIKRKGIFRWSATRMARRGERKARFDQQPLEAAALIDGCYQVLLATGLSSWRRSMDWVFNWFFGENDVGLPLYDYGSVRLF